MLRTMLILGTLLTGAPPVSAHAPIDIAVSNWRFAPEIVRAHVGETMTLRLKSSEGVHGIIAPGLGISKTLLLPGKVMAVSFTPKKAGTYLVHCAIPCGSGHDKMLFTVQVEP
jgi:cytochrome c oxidase subunit 2